MYCTCSLVLHRARSAYTLLATSDSKEAKAYLSLLLLHSCHEALRLSHSAASERSTKEMHLSGSR